MRETAQAVGSRLAEEKQKIAAKPRIFVSSEIKGDFRAQLGTAHYSYRLVAERFCDAFRRRGYQPALVDMPEKFKRPVDLRLGFGDGPGTPVHIAFRSTENLRPMRAAAVNICHFAWEFDVLKDRELISGPITANQKHMLSLMDEIWVPCSYTRDTLLRYGLDRVEVVPTPVCGNELPERLSKAEALAAIGHVAAAPLAYSNGLSRPLNAEMVAAAIDSLGNFPAVGAWLEGRGRIFLTVCNPHDLRKNLPNLIDGFLYAAGPDDLLLVKFVVSGGGTFLDDDLFEHLAKRYRGPIAMYAPNVLVISEYLDERQMSALYSMADFYLSGSHCEGFNLPLLEAMGCGALPVTTRNTAMCDYIDEKNAIVIAERGFPGPVPGMTSDAAGISAVISVADRFDIARAVRMAQQMAPDAYAAMASRGRPLVMERYSEAAVMGLAEARLGALRALRSEERDAV